MDPQCCAHMWKFRVRTVEIQISNTTRDITLENPRTYFYSGYSSNPPSPSVPPGSSDTFQFTNPPFWGCTGVLVYKVTTFTLAIYFSNPLNYGLYSTKLTLELYETKTAPGGPEPTKDIYDRISDRKPALTPTTKGKESYHSVSLDTSEDPAQVSFGHIKVMATMSNNRRSVIRIVVEGQEASGMEPQRETCSK